MDPFLQVVPKTVEGTSSSFHQHLLETLSDLTEQLEQLTVDDSTTSTGSNQSDYFGNRILEVLDSYNYAMVGLNTFLNSLDTEGVSLETELESLQTQKDSLLLERDTLIEKGHELNCRMAYNALVRKLDESFTSLEKNTSEESAKCFRDDAEERLKRSIELIRVANMTSCSIDRDIFKEMEKITNLFENYERDRDLYVKELDLFSDVRRQKISTWMEEPRTEEETQMGETVLDYLSLTQRQRHMEVQVIKNALRMYSFNASLSFDREDNIRLMEELSGLQNKVNTVSGATKVVPRFAKATTNLTRQDDDSPDEAEPSAGDFGREEKKGKGLHRCHRRVNLATDPITEPELVIQLEANLRWHDRSPTPTNGQTDSLSEHHDLPLNSSDSTTDAVLKAIDSTCGDANIIKLQMERSLDFAATDEAMSECKQTDSQSTHNFLRHIESSTFSPSSAEMKITGLVRKKHNVRSVGSLTNLDDTDRDDTNQKLNHRDDREGRSQGNEPAPRPTAGPNKSREHVQNASGTTDQRRMAANAHEDEEDAKVKDKEYEPRE